MSTPTVKVAKRLKSGDTFKALLTITRNGAPVDLSSVAITSQVRQRDEAQTLVSDLTITSVDLPNGQFRVRSESAGWPVEDLDWDVQFVEAGDTWSMPTRQVVVTRDNTQ